MKGSAMIDGLNDYIEYIKTDYSKWGSNRTWDSNDEIRAAMTKDFCDSIRYEVGRKFIKVITGTSVHSFIVLHSDKKFTKGDILKAASWAAPAKNFARGNVIGKNFGNISWTGA
jgi:hypothetical protein